MGHTTPVLYCATIYYISSGNVIKSKRAEMNRKRREDERECREKKKNVNSKINNSIRFHCVWPQTSVDYYQNKDEGRSMCTYVCV